MNQPAPARGGGSAGENLAVSTAVAARDEGLIMPNAVVAVHGQAVGVVPTGRSRLDIVNAKLAGLPPVSIINARIDHAQRLNLLTANVTKAGGRIDQKFYGGVALEFVGRAAVVGKAAQARMYAGAVLMIAPAKKVPMPVASDSPGL